VSPARECPATVEAIAALAVRESRRSGTFRVNVNRADKKFPLHSNALCVELGGRLLSAYPDLRVDLHRPDFTVEVDIREGGRAFVFSRRIPCAGGMPVGSAGLGALMLSGGIDSPVAGHMMAKRGLKLFAVHFHSFPYTSEAAKEKVVALTKILTRYVGSMELVVVPFTAIQEAIHLKCDASFMITIMRRVMMRIACRLAAARGAGAVVTGESLGQVASQTMQSMTVTTAVATLPVFRPVIGMDKDEIVERARAIGSFETSILPYADCCTVFLPPNPQTKPDQARTEFVESKLENLEELIAAAIAAAESIRVKGID
jgi:thiamine biosynthesis protein ThiI